MIKSVTINTGARLHFGLLTHGRQDVRECGGIGLMIAAPGWCVHAEISASDRIEVNAHARACNPESVRRAAEFRDRYRAACPALQRPLSIRIDAAIPGHQGFGSGSQLGLAIAKAIAMLASDNADIVELAHRTGRGRRSAVGIWGFDQGGFIVDAGKRSNQAIGTLLARFDVPANWRFVILTPLAVPGLSGAEEAAALSGLPPMPETTTQQMAHLILLRILPALCCSDAHEFSSALFEYGRLAGDYFRPVQGGIFASPVIRNLAIQLQAAGLPQPVQTSWGPTCAVPCADAEAAARVMQFVAQYAALDVIRASVVEPLNSGADIITKECRE